MFTPLRVFCLSLGLGALGMLAAPTSAHAQAPFGFGFQPFGFYQPYGIQYRSSVPTPPYFALNPPVYYGTRYFRPYGISPFAAPPSVGTPAGYQGQAGSEAIRSRQWTGPVSNPFICRSDAAVATQSLATRSSEPSTDVAAKKPASLTGKMQLNPFVHEELTLTNL